MCVEEGAGSSEEEGGAKGVEGCTVLGSEWEERDV